MSEHWIKTTEPYYSDVESGVKPFEVRRDDRLPAYAVGDILHLQQLVNGQLTGKMCERIVTYTLRDTKFVKEGYVVLGIKAPTQESKPLTIDPLCGAEMDGADKKKTTPAAKQES